MAPSKITSSTPVMIQDYAVLPLICPPTTSYPHQTTHFLYLRPNVPKVPTPDTDRELFLVNLPIDATEPHLRSLFADQLGGYRVSSIDFEDAHLRRHKPTAPVVASKKRKRGNSSNRTSEPQDAEVDTLPSTWDRSLHHSGSTAILTFIDTTSAELAMKAALKASKTRKPLIWGQGIPSSKIAPLGSLRYTTHHALRFPPAAQLQHSIDTFMASFSAAEAERARLLARQRQEPDEDGFVTVVRGGRTGPARLEEAKEKAKELAERNRGKEDFYRFQMREKKKERAGELMRGFEEDRKRVEEMKGRRNKFRPL